MKTNSRIARWLVMLALSTLNVQPSTVLAQGTAFSYQGRLNDGGYPASGVYDLRFTIYDALTDGSAVSGMLTNAATPVTNGMFCATLDFGVGVFTGPGRWLQLDVRTNDGAAAFIALSPRQPLLPVPYAVAAGSASNLLGTLPAAQLSGTLPATQLSGTMPLAVLPAVILTNNEAGPVTFAGPVTSTSLTTPTGQSFLLQPANGLGDGGSINLFAGNAGSATGGSGGSLSLRAGDAQSWGGMGYYGMGAAGTVTIAGGSGGNGIGGNVTIQAGPSSEWAQTMDGYSRITLKGSDTAYSSAGDGGLITVESGHAESGGSGSHLSAGGNITIVGGKGIGGYPGGNIILTPGSGAQNGRVGIGTTNPATALEVAGTVSASGFSGDAGGLTNLNASRLSGSIPLGQLPAAVLTNNQTGVNLNGTFSGNGTGVTNVNLLTVNGAGLLNWGAFLPGSSPAVGASPVSVVAADVNGDGKVDLVSANKDANTLTVLTNNGSGGFGSNAVYSVGPAPFWVAAADVNRDGWVDLVSANSGASTLTVLTNNGSGGFGSNNACIVGGAPYCVAAADVNGDGWADLISANWGGNTLTVLTNDGSGGFVLASTINVGSPPVSVSAADVNGDGKVDLICGSGANTLTVFTNDGSGGFALAGSFQSFVYSPSHGGDQIVSVQTNLVSIVTADFNADGKADLIAAVNTAYEYRYQYFYYVNGHLQWYWVYGNGYCGTVSVLTNNGAGGFVAGWHMQDNYYGGVAAADANGDGKVDLITANYSMPGDTLNTLSVLMNNGSGGFALTSTYNVGRYPNSVTATDVNGDGKADLICANSGDNTLSVLLNTPTFNGSFAGVGSGLTGLSASQLTTGTVPLAQLPSAVVTNNATGVTISGTFNGNGTFSGNGAGLTNVPGALAWQHVTGTSQQAQPNTGYVADNTLPVTITLPVTPGVGDVVRVSGAGRGGWIVGQNDGQSILPAPFSGYSTNSNYLLTNWSMFLSTGSGLASIAPSANGNKWAAARSDGSIINQTGQSSGFPSLPWISVASSADGAKLVAVASSDASYDAGPIYTSTNAGITSTLTSALSNHWWAVASSTNGTKLVAVANADAAWNPGSIYTSANSGSTWTKTSALSNYWCAVASSADGTKLVAASQWNAVYDYGSIYTSASSGSSWTKTGAPSNAWQTVASSADGTRLVAAAEGVGIYTSANSGSTWTLTGAPTSLDWLSVALSGNGSVAVAADGTGYVYVSTNFGTNWTQSAYGSGAWTCVAASADGSDLFAGDGRGAVYTASNLLPVTTTTGTAGYLAGGPFTAIELQYIGGGQWMPLSYVGAIATH